MPKTFIWTYYTVRRCYDCYDYYSNKLIHRKINKISINNMTNSQDDPKFKNNPNFEKYFAAVENSLKHYLIS